MQDPAEEYLRNYELLRAERNGDRTAFVLLAPMEQWALFRYYLPHESRSREVMLDRRREIIELDPELPKQADDALQKMLRIRDALPAYREQAKIRPRTKKNAKKQVVLFSEVNPDLNPEQFAKIIVQAAFEQARREKVDRKGQPE